MNSRFPSLSLGQVLLFALGMFLFAGSSHAAVYACPVANGGTVYQDRPCELAAAKPSSAASGNSSNTPRKPGEYAFGMHASWFTPPLYAPQPAYCDRLGCDCASQTRNFRRGLSRAVVDALFLESAWHRYAEQVIQLKNNPPKGFALFELKIGIEDSACDIQMSQLTVKNYAEAAVVELKAKADAAVSRGNTEFDQCDGSDLKVCADVEAMGLYKRMMQDIDTLTLPRHTLIGDAE